MTIDDAHWTDLSYETNGYIVNDGIYKFGADVHGPSPNEWDPQAYGVNFASNLEATFTYSYGGCSLDGIEPR